MLIKYIKNQWKRLIPTYAVGVAVLFLIFWGIYSLKDPYYRSSFILNPDPNPLEVSNTIENLFGLLMTKDSATFARRLNFDLGQVGRIKSAELDILEGSFIKIDVATEDNEIILPFYHALTNYLNSDSLLNIDIVFIRKRLEAEMAAIESELHGLDSSALQTEPAYWQFRKGSAAEPMISASSSLNRVFLMNRLNELAVQHHNLVSVQPLSAPVIPLKPEKTSKLVYFLFSNVIVLSLMFVQYLFYTNKPSDG